MIILRELVNGSPNSVPDAWISITYLRGIFQCVDVYILDHALDNEDHQSHSECAGEQIEYSYNILEC